MTEIKSLMAPALGEAEVKRLIAMTRASRMKSDSTLFDTGYEQAKRDFREVLLSALRIPHDEVADPTTLTVDAATREGFFAKWRR